MGNKKITKKEYEDALIVVENYLNQIQGENLCNEAKDNLKKHAVSYFYKTEQSMDALKINSKDRAIGRGAMPKPKSKAGRPRNKGNAKEDANNLS